jgi:hypothetical protein
VSFNGAFIYCISYIAPNGRIIVSDELEMMWKNLDITCLKHIPAFIGGELRKRTKYSG